MEWFLKCVKENYCNFQGRARRQEFWFFVLFYVIIMFVLEIIGAIFIGVTGSQTVASIFGILYMVYGLGMLLPYLGVAVRRLHDIDKSGWFVLLGLIPFVGIIILIVFFCTRPTPGDNRFGPNPIPNYNPMQ